MQQQGGLTVITLKIMICLARCMEYKSAHLGILKAGCVLYEQRESVEIILTDKANQNRWRY